MTKTSKVILILFLFAPSFSLRAESFEELAKKGDEYFARRSTIENCLKAIEYYEKACALNPKEINIRLRIGELAHWTAGELGLETLDKKKQIEILKKGVKASEEVLKLEPRNPGAHYWRIWNLAAITVAEGIFSGGYSFKEAIVGTIFVANGDLNYYYAGIYRYWARVIYEIPGLLGKFFHFTDSDSIWLYQQSLAVAPNFFLTRYWMAESYVKMKQQDKAIEQLKIIIRTAPDTIPEVQIENRYYQEQAKKLLAKLDG